MKISKDHDSSKFTGDYTTSNIVIDFKCWFECYLKYYLSLYLYFQYRFVVFTIENISINNYTLIKLEEQLINIKFVFKSFLMKMLKIKINRNN